MARRTTSNPSASRNLGIRNRLLLLLAVPLVGLLAVTGYAMFEAAGRSREAASLSGDAQVSLASYRLVDALQAERKVLAVGQPSDAALRSAVVTASGALRARAAGQGGILEHMTTQALRRVDAAEALARTNTGGLVAVDAYSPAIQDLLDLSRAGLDSDGAVDGRPAATTDLLANAQEAAAHERDLVGALGRRSALLPDQFGPVSLLASAQAIRSTQAAKSAPEDLAVRIDRIGDAIAAASRGRNMLFFDSRDGAATGLEQWTRAADKRVSDLQTLRDDAADRAVAAVAALGSSSRAVLLLAVSAVIAVVLISAALVRSAVRSIARPLGELSMQAEELANVRLPEAVASHQAGASEVHLPVIRASGATEVQEVARAFNGVQETALRLAGEQAVLRRNLAEALTNLGRRNQLLLGRQLDFISSLEQRETDPVFLEHLFKLDHLASRMRRNAESLLILTGSETPRRRRTPARLGEVVRAAMSEVEDFERVRLGHLGDATIAGPAVIDLVHMLAELIENALRFSPPGSTIEIDGRSLQGGYQLAVIDHGVGMADVELTAANQRLAGHDEVDGMPTRYLGQYVIAKLAAKSGALVRLQATAGGRGVTAVVSLPASVIVGGTDRSSIARPLPGTKAARAQGPDLFAPGAGLTVPVEQPDAVIDPAADPFAEPVPATEDLSIDPGERVSEDWGWTPDVIETTATDSGDASAFPVDEGMAATSEVVLPPPPPEWVPDQAWEMTVPASGASVAPDPAAPSHDRYADAAANGSGLTRRVPGASLQDSPLGESLSGPAATPDRSADGVRSMLSAFQSGRSRGRGGLPEDGRAAPDPTTEVGVGTIPPATTIWIDDHPDVSTASELEEPRDH